MKKMMKWFASVFMAAAVFAPVAAQQDNATKKFNDTVKYLDKGGLALEYLDAGTVINNVTSIAFSLLDQFCTTQDEMRGKAIIKDIIQQSGLLDIRGFGSSLVKNNNTYTVKNFLAIDQVKRNSNLLVNLFSGSIAAEMARFVTAQDAFAVAANFNGSVIWKLIDTNAKKYMTNEQQQAQYVMMLTQLQGAAGMPVPELLSSFQGVGLFVKCNKKADGTHDIPIFTVLIDMKNKIVCDKIAAHLSMINPEMVKDGKISFPVPKNNQIITIGFNGKYIYVTNQLNDLAMRLAQQASPVRIIPDRANAASWAYIAPNIGKDLVQFMIEQGELKSLKEKKIAAVLTEVFGLNTPTSIVTTIEPDGFLQIGKTNSALLAFYCGSPRINGLINSIAYGAMGFAHAKEMFCDDDNDDEGQFEE